MIVEYYLNEPEIDVNVHVSDFFLEPIIEDGFDPRTLYGHTTKTVGYYVQDFSIDDIEIDTPLVGRELKHYKDHLILLLEDDDNFTEAVDKQYHDEEDESDYI